MENKIRARWTVSQPEGTKVFTMEELGVSSTKEWSMLSFAEKTAIIQDALDKHPDNPVMVLDNYSTF